MSRRPSYQGQTCSAPLKFQLGKGCGGEECKSPGPPGVSLGSESDGASRAGNLALLLSSSLFSKFTRKDALTLGFGTGIHNNLGTLRTRGLRVLPEGSLIEPMNMGSRENGCAGEALVPPRELGGRAA